MPRISGPHPLARVLALLISAAFSFAQPTVAQQRGVATLRVIVSDADGPVNGAVVEVKLNGPTVATAVTNVAGEVEFTTLTPANYQVTVSKVSFEPLTASNIIMTAGAQVEVRVTMIPKIELKEAISVKADRDTQLDKGASPAVELQRAEVETVPSKPATVADTLPLVPGVVRTSDGEMNIAGAAEHRSALVVNAADVTDPATGQFGMTVPVDSVETIEVFKTPYLAQFGRFTSGVVSVETRRGGDKWNAELNDPLPEFRIRSGHLRGLREASPRLTFNGPLIANKFYFSEGVEYDLQKQPDRTLPFGSNESKQESTNSFTQLDYVLSPTNALTGTFHVAPRRWSFVGLDFFNPQPVTPMFRVRDYTGTLIDRWTLGRNLLESTLAMKRLMNNVWGQGDQAMILTPTGNRGSYFSEQSRRASRVEWIETYSLAPLKYHGEHSLKLGSSVSGMQNRGDFLARPVLIEDAEGRLIRRIDWVGGRRFCRGDLETAFFGQDHWVISPKLAVDAGTRVERQSITQTIRMAPRIGVSWTPFANRHTTIRGGFGLFYDRVPLSVYAFYSYPEQVITSFGRHREIIDGPHHFFNDTERAESRRLPFVYSRNHAGNFAPYSETWNVEVEHPLLKMLRVRANYLQSSSHGVIVFTPRAIEDRHALVLGGGGKSAYRQLELTGRLSLKNDQDLFFSYVHGRSHGDLNEFNGYLGNFPFAVVRANRFTNLSGDLPNRFLAWGLVRLPLKMQFAPLVEWRNGFPYAWTDATQHFVGMPNQRRFPNFYSVDSRASKDVKMSDKYSLRFSVSGFNLTNHFNPLRMHSNIDDRLHGVFFGSHKRRLRLDFDVIF
jgi:Carboxypeptidase regulatory-like domain/TonB dependent receptor